MEWPLCTPPKTSRPVAGTLPTPLSAKLCGGDGGDGELRLKNDVGVLTVRKEARA